MRNQNCNRYQRNETPNEDKSIHTQVPLCTLCTIDERWDFLAGGSLCRTSYFLCATLHKYSRSRLANHIFTSKLFKGCGWSLRSGRLICTISKCIPICVSRLMTVQGWANLTIFMYFSFSAFFHWKNTKWPNMAFFRPTYFLCRACIQWALPNSVKFWGATRRKSGVMIMDDVSRQPRFFSQSEFSHEKKWTIEKLLAHFPFFTITVVSDYVRTLTKRAWKRVSSSSTGVPSCGKATTG